ncbi:hypothetical protein D3C77_276250 [compost metagenome]
MIGVGREGLAGCIDAGAFFQARGEVEAGLIIATREADITLPGLVAAGAQVQAWLQAGLVGTAGEDLYHPTNRIAAVDSRT